MPEPPQVKIKRTFWLMPLLLAVLILVALLWSERVWMMLLVALGAVWLFDYLWARSLARGLSFKRELRYNWAQVGDRLEERFTLSNWARLPALWVEILDHSNLSDYQANLATGVEASSENEWRTTHVCTRRGAYTLGPTTVRTGTPFGIYTLQFDYAARVPLLIMPPLVPLPDIQIAPGGRAYEGRRRASTFERTVGASGLREYTPGDSFKAIHWRAVAHYEDLMVRTFESTPAGDWWIWLDLDRTVQAESGDNSTIEHAVILAASLAERGLSSGRAVGLVANAQQLVWLAPASGELQRLEILRALATVEPGTMSLQALLALRSASEQRSGSVIIVTPAVEGAWMEAALESKTNATTPTVLLLDRATYGGSGSTDQTTTLLAEWGIPHFIITSDILNRPESRPGQAGNWEWRVNATGRAIAQSAPRDEVWRTLA